MRPLVGLARQTRFPEMVDIGTKTIGNNAPAFITFEAGPTHDGLDTALRLVDATAASGADAIKFQIADPDRLIADKSLPFSYDVLIDRETGETETVTETLYDIICRRTLTRDEWRTVKARCDEHGLAFFSTACFDDEIDFLAELSCDSIKIASTDVNNHPFIRYAARTGMCIQLDTGNATLGEVEEAVDVCRAEGNERIIIHQCPSGYPARLESVNLRILKTLKQMFPYPVAFSDHTPGWDMDIAAVALGANMVEKTITFDRMIRSVEHIMSIEPPEMAAFIKAIRDVEIALGTPRRIMTVPEQEKRDAYRRSFFLAEPAKAGQLISEVRAEFRRPGYGISPKTYEEIRNLTFASDLPAEHMVRFSDIGDAE